MRVVQNFDIARGEHPLQYLEDRIPCVKAMMRHHHRELSFLKRTIPTFLKDRVKEEGIADHIQELKKKNSIRKFSVTPRNANFGKHLSYLNFGFC